METAHRRACCFEEAFIERFVNDSARRVTMMVSTLRITDQPPRATRNNSVTGIAWRRRSAFSPAFAFST
jgi:hypothetical protein